MSSTNRGSTRDPLDYYITPAWCTQAVLEYLGTIAVRDGGRVLDPGCGTGEIFTELLEWHAKFPKRRDLNVIGVELDRERAKSAVGKGAKILCTDFLRSNRIIELCPFDLVIMNPPFSLAMEFWERSMSLIEFGASIIMFGRRGLVEGKARKHMWEKGSGWRNECVFPKRPTCREGKKGNDSTSYSWFRWTKGYPGATQVNRLFIPGYDD